ncbi:MAG: AAA family ATPase [Gemmatimonadetes bacterium]|nr:AAA family ATPase [Gemmatimonadota bacterium]NIY12578.1 AAA family ATPase [Gemmatimonadota bacterium]
MLVAKETQALLQAVLNPAVFRPDGIREAIELVDEILVPPQPGLAYPWPCLDRLTHGQRPAEMVTWTAGTGIGKSQVLREVVYHLHQTHGLPVGVIALEESARHSAQAQLSLDLGVPLHIPERRADVSDEEIRGAAERVLTGMYLYDHFGSVEATSILPKIRYMVKAFGVKFVVLDHLSIMVSGYATDGDERKRIDEIVTRLRSLVQELDIGVHLVSHLRKASGTPYEEGGQISLVDLRGSGAIAQVSDLVIGLERNQQSEVERHVTTVRVLKNRFSGETGTAGWLRFETASGRMVECEKPSGDDAVTFSPMEGEV